MENILVIKLSALGDFVQALGPMKAIRNHHKNAKITLLTTKPFVGFAEGSGYFDEVIIDQRPRFFEFAKWVLLRNQLQETKYSHIYDLQNNGRVRKYYKPLFKQGFTWHSIQNKAEKEIHASIRHKEILRRAGIKSVALDKLDWAKGDIAVLNLPKKYILLIPGCDPSRPEKRWPAENYAAIAQHFAAKRTTPIILGTKDEQKEADIILRNCPETLSLIGKTSLFDIPAIARSAVGAIGNDTGPMHMIGPTGCKSLVLFSYASDPEKHAPIGRYVKTLREPVLKDLPVDDVLKVVKVWK